MNADARKQREIERLARRVRLAPVIREWGRRNNARAKLKCKAPPPPFPGISPSELMNEMMADGSITEADLEEAREDFRSGRITVTLDPRPYLIDSDGVPPTAEERERLSK